MKTEFRKVDAAKGHLSTYHVYVRETRVGRVGKTDAGWLAYTTTNKRVGEPTKTRASASSPVVEQAVEAGLIPLTIPTDLVFSVEENKTTASQAAAELQDDVDPVIVPLDPPDESTSDSVEVVPEDAPENETESARVNVLDTTSPSSDTSAVCDSREAANCLETFPSTRETDTRMVLEQPVPSAPKPSGSSDLTPPPSWWDRVKSWFRDA